MNESNGLGLRVLRLLVPGTYSFIASRAPSPLKTATPPVPVAPAPVGSLYFLRVLTDLMTVGLMIENFVEFYTNGAVWSQGSNLSYLYLTVLSAYSGDRALGEWSGLSDSEIKKRRGWLFVTAWVVLAFALCSAAGFYKDRFKEPHDIFLVTGGVIGIFLGSEISKRYLAKLQGQGELQPTAAEDLKENILSALAAAPKGLTSSEIMKRAGASKKRVLKALEGLAAEGRVRRVAQGPNDPNTRYQAVE